MEETFMDRETGEILTAREAEHKGIDVRLLGYNKFQVFVTPRNIALRIEHFVRVMPERLRLASIKDPSYRRKLEKKYLSGYREPRPPREEFNSVVQMSASEQLVL